MALSIPSVITPHHPSLPGHLAGIHCLLIPKLRQMPHIGASSLHVVQMPHGGASERVQMTNLQNKKVIICLSVFPSHPTPPPPG